MSAGGEPPPRGDETSTIRLSLGLPRGKVARSAVGNPASRGVPPRGASLSSSTSPAAARDDAEAVQRTDTDALVSRLSAMNASYLPPEPFSYLLATPSQLEVGAVEQPNSPPPLQAQPRQLRRPPLINIGTCLRCAALDGMIRAFLLQGDGKKQIVSLGAGSDARFWRIQQDPELSRHLAHYLELDYEDVTRVKIQRIMRHAQLRDALGAGTDPPAPSSREGNAGSPDVPDPSLGLGSLQSARYSLHACDLRQLSSGPRDEHALAAFRAKLGHHLDRTLPTLVLAECVLAYLSPSQAEAVLGVFASHLRRPTFVTYDICVAGDGTERLPSAAGGSASSSSSSSPFGIPSGAAVQRGSGLRSVVDELEEEEKEERRARQGFRASRFGGVMLQNLEARGLLLQGARSHPTPLSHAERLRSALASAQPRAATGSSQTPALGTSVPPGARELGSDAAAGTDAGCKSLRAVWADLDAAERSRLSRLEGLDEVEELEMLLSHYAIAWACLRTDDVQGEPGSQSSDGGMQVDNEAANTPETIAGSTAGPGRETMAIALRKGLEARRLSPI